jgi:hypothetical protein
LAGERNITSSASGISIEAASIPYIPAICAASWQSAAPEAPALAAREADTSTAAVRTHGCERQSLWRRIRVDPDSD